MFVPYIDNGMYSIYRQQDNIDAISNISYCTVCDANLYKDKTVGIIGNENSIDDVLYLASICKKVIFISQNHINYSFSNEKVELKDLCVINTLAKENGKVINKWKISLHFKGIRLMTKNSC